VGPWLEGKSASRWWGEAESRTSSESVRGGRLLKKNKKKISSILWEREAGQEESPSSDSVRKGNAGPVIRLWFHGQARGRRESHSQRGFPVARCTRGRICNVPLSGKRGQRNLLHHLNSEGSGKPQVVTDGGNRRRCEKKVPPANPKRFHVGYPGLRIAQ